VIVTGQVDHSEEYKGDQGLTYNPMPWAKLIKSEQPEDETEAVVDHINKLTGGEERAYRRVKSALIRKGYLESDFDQGGALYGWSTNELIDLARVV